MGADADLKKSRVKGYFLQSARDIILSKGVEGIAVREIADRAGYSFATIHHYFSDLDDLLLQTKKLMIQDVIEYMDGHPAGEDMGLSELKRQNRLYAEYYLARPHVFRFLYSYHLKNEYQPDDYDFQGSWDKTFRVMVEDGTLSVEEVSIAARTVIYALHGLLALYFSSNGLTKDALLEELDAVADFVIRRKERA